MNKILIVGHPASGCQEVETLLHHCGMQDARPSRRDELLPQDVTATLCKAHKAPPAETVVAEDDFHQINAGPVWHGMALDVMLGNLDQPLWGWTDPQAIYTLDYWKELDPKLTFVLVYDEPHRLLIEAARADGELPSALAVQQMLDNWTAYNGALLRFFLRHPSRCLLVHSQQVRRAIDAYLRQLQLLLDTPLELEAAPMLTAEQPQGDSAADVATDGATEMATRLPAALAAAVATAGIAPDEAAALMDTGAAERYLVEEVLAKHPAAQQLYAELQSAANLPLDGPKRPRSEPASAWATLVRQRAFVSGVLVQFQAEYQRMRGELTEAHSQETELLLDQLHHVQEELEQTYLRKQVLEQRSVDLEREHQRQAAEAKAELDTERAAAAKTATELCRKHEDTAKQLSIAQAQLKAEKAARAKETADLHAALHAAAERDKELEELRDENELLLSQLYHAQEELERFCVENHPIKQSSAPLILSPPHGAALRVKRQLSYRLGATLIQRSRSVSGWVSIPWALAAEVRAFRKERAARPAQKFPPIHTYGDAHEAERLKKHLSYRLGQTLLKHGKSPVGWLKLPFALRREVKQFRQQRKGE